MITKDTRARQRCGWADHERNHDPALPPRADRGVHRRGYGLYFTKGDTLQFLELQADNDHCADQLLQAAREKTGAANARILLAENQTLYLGSGRRCGYGMIAFLGRPFSVTDAYFRMLL